MAKRVVIGLAAHVDAGKTTLSEAMLFLSGAVRRQGRVDHGDAFLDTEKMEKERGITIFSKQARLTWKRSEIILLDTPGHTDFSGETERAIQVMDGAVLVISGTEGVQAHTVTLWRLLEKAGVPTLLFVNKMDRAAAGREELLDEISRRLTDRAVDFTDPDPEKIALCDETCLDAFLRQGEVPERLWRRAFQERRLFPCFFGAALRNEGVEKVLDFCAGWEETAQADAPFGALVYKVARDPQGARLCFMKITGGALKARELLSLRDANGEVVWAEKAAELRRYSGAKYEPAAEAEAGDLCCAVGLSRALPGDALGAARAPAEGSLRPCYSCRLVPAPRTDLHALLQALRALEEEEPMIRAEYEESRREIRIQSMGDVYLEVLKRQLEDRFGFQVSFGESSVLYRETIADTVEGMGHYEPLRHYAEVHLLLEPLPAGSGLRLGTAVSTDELALNWQRLILTHLKERVYPGVLTGSPITDMRITLVAGKAHLKHTEGGDFRQATCRALRQGLMKAHSVLLEPWLRLEITVPEEQLGRVMNDISRMAGAVEDQQTAGEGLMRVTAAAPAKQCAGYGREAAVFTRGRGSVAAAFLDYRPCADPETVIAERGYDPLRDTYNPPDSVFCSHGAGVVVSWEEADRFMHLPSVLEEQRRRAAEARQAPERARASAYRGTAQEDEALRVIFERTYGPARSRELMTPVRKEAPATGGAAAGAAAETPEREILLVDGYNVLFAWEEWKSQLNDNLEGARYQLMDLMCNYAGMTGRDVILVFDGYRVKGNPGEVEKYRNIFVVYTREAQTADAYIEKTTLLARKEARVRVVTSDRPEQLIALGNAAGRTSAREFREEVIRVQGSIAAFLAKNNRRAGEKALERAYKEAWKKKATGQQLDERRPL